MMNPARLFLSHNLSALFDHFFANLEIGVLNPLELQTVLVPNRQVKEWLLLKMAQRKGIVMGLKVCEVGKFLNTDEMSLYCQIYAELRKSQDPELVKYLGNKKKRLLRLAEQVLELFVQHSKYGALPTQNWQIEIFQRLPQLTLPQCLPVSIHCFAIDEMPSVLLDWLFHSENMHIYLFSPCMEFWAETRSAREKKKTDFEICTTLLGSCGKIGRE